MNKFKMTGVLLITTLFALLVGIIIKSCWDESLTFAAEEPPAIVAPQPKASTEVLVERRQLLLEQMQKLDAQLKLIPYYVREIDAELQNRELADKLKNAQKTPGKAEATKP